MAVICRAARLSWPVLVARVSRIGRCLLLPWLFWPVSVALMSRIGRYLLHEVAVPARIAGRYEPCWPVICSMAWLFWPVSLAAMSRTGRYLLSEVAGLARAGGRHEPYWPLLAVWRGCSGPCRWPL